jgi:hypothetical protein
MYQKSMLKNVLDVGTEIQQLALLTFTQIYVLGVLITLLKKSSYDA